MTTLYQHPDDVHSVTLCDGVYCVWYGDSYLGEYSTLIHAIAACTSFAELWRESGYYVHF